MGDPEEVKAWEIMKMSWHEKSWRCHSMGDHEDAMA